jgi:GNAT superfamily N-acetyltransferase
VHGATSIDDLAMNERWTMTPTDDRTLRARRATHRDLEHVIHVLVESHATYAWESWALPGADRRSRLTQLYRADLELVALPHGEVWITDGGESVAVWLPRGAYAQLGDHDLAELERVSTTALAGRRAALEEVDNLVALARRPSDWLLATMGTLPTSQGRGLGSTVLEPRLRELDRNHSTAGLETSTTDNVRFYRRHGFEVDAEIDSLPYGAPTTWLMRRSPTDGASPPPRSP